MKNKTADKINRNAFVINSSKQPREVQVATDEKSIKMKIARDRYEANQLKKELDSYNPDLDDYWND